MKKLLLTLIIFTSFISSAFAKSTTVQIRDKRGNYQRKYVTEGAKTQIFDKKNNRNGYYKKENNKIYEFSKNGNHKKVYTVEE